MCHRSTRDKIPQSAEPRTEPTKRIPLLKDLLQEVCNFDRELNAANTNLNKQRNKETTKYQVLDEYSSENTSEDRFENNSMVNPKENKDDHLFHE